MTHTRTGHHAPPATGRRRGFSLIEIIVAMSMIAIAFTSLMALQVKITQRQTRISEQSARNAILLQEVNRVESMSYLSLATLLVSDTSFSSTFPYIRRYTLNSSATPAGTGQHPYTYVTIRVIPVATPSDSVVAVVRRTYTPSINPLFTP
jgi:prepilin-type N-terminal cleavage/methylation domain-containing protein